MFGSREEVRAAFRRLDDAGMLYLARRSKIPSGPNGEAIVSAFFAFPKTEDTDRTIQDRRGPNALERRLKGAAQGLPHGCCFAELQLRSGQSLRAHLDDLPDCFHSVITSDERSASNAISRHPRP